MIRLTAIICLNVFCFFAVASAQEANCTNYANSSGVFNTKLYRSLIDEGIEHGFPGFILAVNRGNKFSFLCAGGESEIERGINMKSGERFHIASITKIFTATAVLKLIDDERLSLDTQVNEVLDRNLIGSIPYIDEITVSRLLDHSSGIYGFNNDKEYVETWLGSRVKENVNWTPERLVALAYANRVKPFGKPGSGNFYGDTNYVLLGLIVEEISGLPLRQYVKKEIFDAIDLKDTAYYGPDKNPERIELPVTTQGYLKHSKIIDSFVKLDDGFKRAKGDLINTTRAGEKIDASAGIVSTAADLIKFGRALYGGRLLSEKSMEWLLSSSEGFEKAPFGAKRQSVTTVYRESFGILFTSEGDGPGGTNAILAYHPKTDTLIVGFTNIFGLFDETDFMRNRIIRRIILEIRNSKAPHYSAPKK